MKHATGSVKIAILVLPETSASVVFGMYDLFLSAGRDWGIVVDGCAGPQFIQPLLTSAQPAPFMCASGIRLEPQATLEQCTNADVVCVPEIAIPPGEPLKGRFTEELQVAAALPQRRRHDRHSVFRGDAAGGSRPAGRP